MLLATLQAVLRMPYFHIFVLYDATYAALTENKPVNVSGEKTLSARRALEQIVQFPLKPADFNVHVVALLLTQIEGLHGEKFGKAESQMKAQSLRAQWLLVKAEFARHAVAPQSFTTNWRNDIPKKAALLYSLLELVESQGEDKGEFWEMESSDIKNVMTEILKITDNQTPAHILGNKSNYSEQINRWVKRPRGLVQLYKKPILSEKLATVTTR